MALISTCHQVIHLQINLEYKLVDVNVFESSDKKWYQDTVILAQKDSTNIQLAMTLLSGTKNMLSDMINFTPYTLPFTANCFSATIINNKGHVILDCQTVN